MTDSERVGRLFRDALGRPAEERDTLLASVAAEDEAAARRVKELLEADRQADVAGFLARPLFEVASRLLSGRAGHLGPYELLEELGRGGMGVVFKARDTRDGRVVALKVLSPAAVTDPAAAARLRREREALGKVISPHVVRLLAADTLDGMDVLVLEYVPGRTLASVVRDGGPLPAREACRVLTSVARGLHAAHRQGVVHRDVKPGNVMLTPEGEVRLLDFGAAALADAAEALTRPGAGLGTMDYIAPEQIDAAGPAAASADWYSFGCVAYFLLTGRAPFADRPTEAGKLLAHKMQQPPRLGAGVAPAPVAALVEALLAKDPRARPSCADVLRALSALDAGAGQAPAPQSEISRPEWVCFSLLLVAGLVASLALVSPNRSGAPMIPQLEKVKLALEVVVVACGAAAALAALLSRLRRRRWALWGLVGVGLTAAAVAAALWLAPRADAEAPAPPPPPGRRSVPPLVPAAAHLGSEPAAAQPDSRIVTFSHLPEDEREPWRVAVSDWIRQAFPGSAIKTLGPDGAALVIRLRTAEGSVAEAWGRLVSGDPYALKSDTVDDPELRAAFKTVTALTRTGHPAVRGDWLLSVVSPGHPLMGRYREPLDLARAAAEVGVAPDLLVRRLAEDEALAPLGLGALGGGGKIGREEWAGRMEDDTTRFQALCARLGVGYPLTR